MKRIYTICNKLSKGGGIYKISCKHSDKVYIGETINLVQRMYKHFSRLRNNKHSNPVLQNIFNKYGEDSFVVEVLEYIDTKDELLLKTKELEWQKKYTNCISFDSNVVFIIDRDETYKEKQKQQLDEARKLSNQVCTIPIIVYDIVDKKLIEFPSVREATKLIEHKHLQRNLYKNDLTPYKARYVGFKKKEFNKSKLKNILYTTSNIGTKSGSYMLFNFLNNQYKLYNSKAQFSLAFSKSVNDKLYDKFDNKIDHNFYSTKIPKTKKEFFNMFIEITPSKMKFYRYFKVKDVYNAFKTGRDIYEIAKLLGCFTRTLKNAFTIRSKEDWIKSIEIAAARVKSI